MSERRRVKSNGSSGVYHAMSRVVGGQMLLGDREKEVFRKMLWQIADFCGVEVLTYCIMSNHFHVLVRVPEKCCLPDSELLRRFRVLYPMPTKYQTAEFRHLEASLTRGDADAGAIRERLLARMNDLSEFMKTLKQRFSIWYNRNHDNRLGTLWMERFKSVLVEGVGNPLQTMAAYIDLNPVRAGLVDDPKDYRFCGYAEAVGALGEFGRRARSGLLAVWRDRVGRLDESAALKAHRMLIFGKGSSPWTQKGRLIDEKKALRVLNEEQGQLPKMAVLRCRVRYFTDGAIFGSAEFVEGFVNQWQSEQGRKHPPKAHALQGADWGNLAVIRGLRRKVFG